jgi:hypothetical protein
MPVGPVSPRTALTARAPDGGTIDGMTDVPPDQRTAQESATDEARVGRYSRGLEEQPPTASKLHRGRFSQGLEQRPENARKRRPGRFSDGVDHDAAQRPERRRGSFADVEAEPHEPA